eukprot:TRINITY_DN2976_c0_g1_i5.p1 TRINITY_DN2976_c0_g1~~TRINITY_DN2976_c0_g1_i5.p1  ORF type:complete len:313 (+),score=68.80 TRINITY_DN2976_c0_g1_i5:76-939(+)
MCIRDRRRVHGEYNKKTHTEIHIQNYFTFPQMKRTKETFFRQHPEPDQREGLSGLKEFDGEDLEYDARRKYFQEQQKHWILEQTREKEEKKRLEKEEEMIYAKQTLELNRMRGMLEDAFKTKKHDIQGSTRDENLLLAQSKRDKEAKEKDDQKRKEQEEIALLLERGKKKPYQPTQQLRLLHLISSIIVFKVACLQSSWICAFLLHYDNFLESIFSPHYPRSLLSKLMSQCAHALACISPEIIYNFAQLSSLMCGHYGQSCMNVLCLLREDTDTCLLYTSPSPRDQA